MPVGSGNPLLGLRLGLSPTLPASFPPYSHPNPSSSPLSCTSLFSLPTPLVLPPPRPSLPFFRISLLFLLPPKHRGYSGYTRGIHPGIRVDQEGIPFASPCTGATRSHPSLLQTYSPPLPSPSLFIFLSSCRSISLHHVLTPLLLLDPRALILNHWPHFELGLHGVCTESYLRDPSSNSSHTPANST